MRFNGKGNRTGKDACVIVAVELAEFCEAMFPRLCGVLAIRLGDRAVAEELAQEVLVRACGHWDRLAKMEGREHWTYRVAMNLANSWFRRHLAERRALTRARGREEPAAGADVQAALRLDVRAAVAALPPRQREVIALRFFADLPVDTVAAIMRCAPGTVKSLTSRAGDNLRKSIPAYLLEEIDRD